MAFREECGIFGIWNHPESSRLTYLGLYALQHRGQESAGIVSLDNKIHYQYKCLGLVADHFSAEQLDMLIGRAAVGHVRYSTTGENFLANAQPLTAQLPSGPLAIGHNGNFVNTQKLKSQLQEDGAIFQGTSDTEVLLHLIAKSKKTKIEDKIMSSLEQVSGAYSFVILNSESLIGVRDPMGFRPLSLGEITLESGEKCYALASETCAFDLIGARFVRDIEPGEVIYISKSGVKSFHMPKSKKLGQCVFEHVYFSRPDSVVFGRSVYESRKSLGKILAREWPVEADLVIPVPDSGVAAALGFSEESKIPFEMGIIRNHYVGRTFIEPRKNIRSFGVKVKLNPMSSLLKGKRVVVVDDSIVRGTTSQKIIGLIRAAGAKEVHFRIAAPPTTGPCYYGVDTPSKSELIASRESVDGIRKFVGADSLGYLSNDGLFKAVKGTSNEFCAACFDNKYPTEIP